MNYLITPPNLHYDGGLGITACIFSHAADALKEADNAMIDTLPICYLQRHSIELFLKSFIVILHKKYNISYGEGFSLEKPAIKTHSKWVPLSSTHNLSDLFHYFKEIFDSVSATLPSRTDWTIAPDIEDKIKLISGSDPKSTYFRYPESTTPAQDAKKSGIQTEDLSTIFAKINDSNEPAKCTLLVDENYNVIEAYNLKSSPIPNTIFALNYLGEFFYNLHAAFRIEITRGL
ncbi:hypothetical protein [Pseudomonas putida]|uniref:hypothetical protein n=1 Tax=Pseudomonas putida TaxID=303 RepID=UPI000646E55B|nr:hypothetical protein [Pseudomonas putida]